MGKLKIIIIIIIINKFEKKNLLLLKKKHKLNFFTFKTPKTTILSLGRIFVTGGFRVLAGFLVFFVIMDWFNKISIVFSRYFGSKIG